MTDSINTKNQSSILLGRRELITKSAALASVGALGVAGSSLLLPETANAAGGPGGVVSYRNWRKVDTVYINGCTCRAYLAKNNSTGYVERIALISRPETDDGYFAVRYHWRSREKVDAVAVYGISGTLVHEGDNVVIGYGSTYCLAPADWLNDFHHIAGGRGRRLEEGLPDNATILDDYHTPDVIGISRIKRLKYRWNNTYYARVTVLDPNSDFSNGLTWIANVTFTGDSYDQYFIRENAYRAEQESLATRRGGASAQAIVSTAAFVLGTVGFYKNAQGQTAPWWTMAIPYGILSSAFGNYGPQAVSMAFDAAAMTEKHKNLLSYVESRAGGNIRLIDEL